MTGQKTHQILQQFSPEQLKSFENYLKSPFHVSEGRLFLKLVRGLLKYYKTKTKEAEKQLFNNLYPKEKYKAETARQRLSHLSTKLNQHIYDFLAHSQLKKDQHLKNTLLLKISQQQHLELNLLNRKWATIWENEVRKDIYNIAVFERQHELTFQKFVAEIDIKVSIQAVQLLIDSIHEFDKNQFLKRLILCCQLKNFKNIFDFEIPTDTLWTLEEAKKIVEENKLGNHVLVEIHATVYHILHHRGDHNAIQLLKEKVLPNLALFETEMAAELTTYLSNFYIYIIRSEPKRRGEYYELLFELYESQLANNLLTSQRYLPLARLRNIIGLAQHLGYTDKAKQLINDGCELINPNIKESAKSFLEANFFFTIGNFASALEQLRYFHRKTGSFMALDVKALEIRIFYETRELEVLDFRLTNFEQYIRTNRKSITNDIRTSYQSFIKATRKLMRLTQNVNATIPQIEDAIAFNQTTNAVYATWIIQKLTDLKEEKK